MKFLHKFKTLAEFQNSPYFPKTEKPTVEAIVVGGVTYYYSEPGPSNYYIWVNPENSEQWVDSDGKRNPAVGDSAFVLGNTSQSIEGIIEYEDTGESEEESVEYEQPWIGWVYETGYVTYNRYNLNGHDYVDLGLPSGTLWATCNVGADSPEEYGNFYAWGETETKSTYTWDNYKWGTQNSLTKYTLAENKFILDPEDDIAHVYMGGGWHMPTHDDFDELLSYTMLQYTTTNGVDGILFTSMVNSKSIFFPLAGHKDNSWREKDTTFAIWASHWIQNNGGETNAIILYWTPDGSGINYFSKYYGFPVRGCINPNKSNPIAQPESPIFQPDE